MANGKETGQIETRRNKEDRRSENQVTDARQAERDSQTDFAKPWMQYAGMGVELASYTLAMTAMGFAIDRYRGHDTPIATAIGTMIGFSFGMFRFIQRASNASKN